MKYKHSPLLALALASLAATGISQATTIDWDGDTSVTWATGGNWVGGTAPANSLTTDIARFNLASAPSFAPTATSTSNVLGVQIGDGTTNTAALTITTGTSGNRLGIGADGITMYANAGTTIIGNASGQGVRVGATQTWTNNSSNLLTVGSITNHSNTTPYTLTLAGSGNISTHASGTITNNSSGTLALLVDSGGTFTIGSGTSTYTGGLTIKRGTVSGSGATSFGGTGGIVYLGDTTLSNSNNATLAQTGAVTVANNITVNSGSSGTLKITANQNTTFSGAVTLNNALTVENTATANSRKTTLSGQITGSSPITVQATTLDGNYGVILTGNNASSFSGNVLAKGLLSFANDSLGSAVGAGSLQIQGNTWLQWNGTNTQDISGKILNPSGNTLNLDLLTNNVAFGTTNGLTGSSGTITKTNTAGILTLNAANNFSGTFNTGTTVGGVVIGHSNALQNATVNPSSGALSFASGVTSAAFGNLTGSSFSLTNAGSAAVALTVGGNGLDSSNIGVISGTGSITQNGAGKLALAQSNGTPTNTFSGGVNLLAGSLEYRGAATAGSDVQTGGGNLVGGMWGTGTVTLGNGTATDVTLNAVSGSGNRYFSNNIVFAGDVTVGGAGTQAIVFNMFTDGITIAAGDALTTPNTITLTRTNELTTNNSMQFWGEVKQSGGTYGITKLGAGTLTLGGGESVANTFAGDVTVNAGIVLLGKAANIDAIAGNVVISGGTLNTGSNAQQINNAATITMSSGTLTVGNTETIAGLSITGGAGTGSGTLTIDTGGSASISNSSYTYNLTTAANGLTLGNNATSSGTVILNGNLAYTGTTTASQLTLVDLGGSTRTFTVANGSAASDLVVTGDISNGGLTKDGAGTLLLSGGSTYAGATTVNDGKLLINGSTSSTSLVTVNTGATLGGTGTVGGALTLNSGAFLSPGASIESLATGSNIWDGGSTFIFEFSTDGTGTAGTDWDLLAITGNLDLSGASNLDPINFDLVTMANATTSGLLGTWNANVDHTWSGFVTTTSGVTGFAANLFSIDTAGFQNPINGTFSIAQNGNNLDLVYTANLVPEPRAALLGGLGLLMLLRRRR